MGTKYSSKTISGYNAVPPPDDGSQVEANKTKWQQVKEKIGDPVKTLVESINSALVTHFDNGPVAISSSTSIGATHYGKILEVSATSVSLTLGDAATLGAGWYCTVKVVGTENVTIARTTGADTIDGTAADKTAVPGQSFMVIVKAAADGFLTTDNDTIRTSVGFELNVARYEQTLDASANVTSITGIELKTDGTKLYIVDTADDRINQYSLATAWDISTASFETSLSVSAEDTSPWGMRFKPDGTRAFLVGQATGKIWQYDLGTAWDISTATVTTSVSVTSEDSQPVDILFSAAGTEMILLGESNNQLFEYTLSSAWDISTASYTSDTYDLSSVSLVWFGLDGNTDRTYLYLVDNFFKFVREFSLQTAMDLQNVANTEKQYSVFQRIGNPGSLRFGDSGRKMYLAKFTSNVIYQYGVGFRS